MTDFVMAMIVTIFIGLIIIISNLNNRGGYA